MNKQVKILISLAAVFVLLCGGVAALLLTDVPEASDVETSSGPESAALTLLQKEETELVSIESSTGFYAEYDAESGKIVIPSLSGLPLDEDVLGYLARFSVNITGQQEINGGELSDYGITENSPTVTITYSDGSTAVLKIGSGVPGASTPGSYVLFEDRVYVMYDMHIHYFVAQPSEYISAQITPANYDSESGAYIYKVTGLQFSGPGGDFSIDAESGGLPSAQFHTGYCISLPGGNLCPADETVFTNAAESLFGMTGEVAAFALSEEELDLASFGLGSGSSTAALEAVGFSDESLSLSFTLLASNPTEGKIYLHVLGSNVIYSVSESDAPLWYGCELSDFYAAEIFVPSIESTAKITLETPEYTVIFSINRDGSGNIENADVLKTEGGENASAVITSTDFSAFFNVLTKTKQYGAAQIPEGETPATVLKITVEYSDGTGETLELYEGPALQVYASVNGCAPWLLKSEYAEGLLEAALGFFG
ncbi:MAG: DUF4340 domain-containing protein [Oscillospiraceae bacterium]